MNGYGEYSWKDGRFYKGNYLNGEKDGFGIYRWADSRLYIGYWKNGKQDGFGKYVFIGGEVKFGIWKEGNRTLWLNDVQIEQLKAQKDKKFIFVLQSNYQKQEQ